jgi:hypothetical protein
MRLAAICPVELKSFIKLLEFEMNLIQCTEHTYRPISKEITPLVPQQATYDPTSWCHQLPLVAHITFVLTNRVYGRDGSNVRTVTKDIFPESLSLYRGKYYNCVIC